MFTYIGIAVLYAPFPLYCIQNVQLMQQQASETHDNIKVGDCVHYARNDVVAKLRVSLLQSHTQLVVILDSCAHKAVVQQLCIS